MTKQIRSQTDLNGINTADATIDEIIFAPGRYYLSHPLVFRNRSKLTLRAEGEAVLCGGEPLSVQWTQKGDQLYRAPLSLNRALDGLQVGARRFHMARYPHAGSEGVYRGTAADAMDFAARAEQPQGGYVHALHSHSWGDVHYEIAGRLEDGSLDLRGGWQNNRPMGMHKRHRFVENLFEALGAPGEFYHDAEAGVLYVCAEQMPTSDIVAIINPYLLQFHQCDDVSLIGLTFAHTARTFMRPYEQLLRSDWCIHRGGAVLFEDGQGARVHACEFTGIGSNALFFSGAARGARVTGCHLHHLDASAVCFVGKPDSVREPNFTVDEPEGVRPVADMDGVGPRFDQYVHDCVVEDCLIHDIGAVEKQVAGVQVSMAARITMRHLSIYRCPRAAFNIGEGAFGGHLIEYCDAFDTVLETGDHGTFNGWGRDRFWHQPDMDDRALHALALRVAVETTYIRFNRKRSDHGWDIDLDDGCSNYVVEGNLCLNGGIKLREGFGRVVRNNLCIGNGIHVHVWYGDSGDIIENNITTHPYHPIMMPERWGARIDHNILHTPGAQMPRPAKALQGLSGQDEHSATMDVDFADPAKGDFLVRNRWAEGIGFVQPPIGNYGVRSHRLKAMAKSAPIPAEISFFEYADVETYNFDGILLKNIETDSEMSAFQTAGRSGVIVLTVPEFHPLRAQGLAGNQAIVAVDGVAVENVAKLQTLLLARAGKEVALRINTGGGTVVKRVRFK